MNEEKKASLGGSGFLSFLSFVLLPIFAFSLGYQLSERKFFQDNIVVQKTEETGKTEKKTEKIDLSVMRDTLKIVEEKFVDPSKIDPEKLKYALARAIVWSLEDPYSEFMSPEESQEFSDEIDGNLEGIGAELTVKNGTIVVVSPLRDSPAEHSGILPNDILLTVDGEEAHSDDFLNVIKKIRGAPGTEVKLTFFRPDSNEEKEITVTRAKIRVETVKLDERDDIAILEVSQFGTNTETEFYAALTSALAKNPKGIVVDLRFNSGGFLDTAIKMVSAFQKSGKVVIQEGRPPDTESHFVTGNVKTDIPLVVLQNGGSASASEIFAGAMQDSGRGIVIGEQSFGKGTVQELIPMSGGANLRITIARWLTPKGRSISKVGITPNLIIERTTEDFENERDPQMDAAIEYLQGETLESLVEKFNGKIPEESVSE